MPYQFRNKTVYNLGERGSGVKPRWVLQDFKELRDECLRKGTLFEDPAFLAVDESVGIKRKIEGGIRWLRPKEICSNPRFVVDGFSRLDVKQGQWNDCWVIAALTALTTHKDLFEQVVPTDQEFDDKYAGIFHFRFWNFGKWIDVVVDDRLPCFADGSLIGANSVDGNEFWTSLVEKAYAKLHGSYEGMDWGKIGESMEDFTGGVTEVFDVREGRRDPNLFKIMLRAHERSSLLSASINMLRGGGEELMVQTGLVRGHAYSLTSVKELHLPEGDVHLVRCRNPWGAFEWKGAWSDGSAEWSRLSEAQKAELEVVTEEDGEFWMAFEDFINIFSMVEVCNLTPDALSSEGLKKWNLTSFEGSWVKGATAGGCPNYEATFTRNPQFLLTVPEPGPGEEAHTTLVVALMQKDRRRFAGPNPQNLYIEVLMYAVDDPMSAPRPLTEAQLVSTIGSWTYRNRREMTHRYMLAPGSYAIVVSTFDPDEEAEFLLRIFSERPVKVTEHDCDVAVLNMAACSASSSEALDLLFAVHCGEDQLIDSSEVREALNCAFTFTKFSLETARGLLKLYDTDNSGMLNSVEFSNLWHSVQHAADVFKQHDKDGSGLLEIGELEGALREVGVQVNKKTLVAIVRYFAPKKGGLDLDDFIAAVVKVKNAAESGMELSSLWSK